MNGTFEQKIWVYNIPGSTVRTTAAPYVFGPTAGFVGGRIVAQKPISVTATPNNQYLTFDPNTLRFTPLITQPPTDFLDSITLKNGDVLTLVYLGYNSDDFSTGAMLFHPK